MVQRRQSPGAADLAREWHVYLVFDGGSLGNPGQGYGSFVYKGVVSQTEPVVREYPGETTSNEAEYMTLIQGLEMILESLQATGQDPADLKITVRSDSKLVIEQVSGRWKIKKAELRPLAQQAQMLLNQFKSWNMAWHPRSESVRILGH